MRTDVLKMRQVQGTSDRQLNGNGGLGASCAGPLFLFPLQLPKDDSEGVEGKGGPRQ